MAGEVPSSAMNLGGGTPSSMPKHVETTLLVGETITFATLYGTWRSMKTHQRRQELAGRNPYHEQLTGNLTRKWTHPELGSGLKSLTGHKQSIATSHPPSPTPTTTRTRIWRSGVQQDRAALLADPPYEESGFRGEL